MSVVKVRLHEPRLKPRRTRLAMPGWAGDTEPRKDGSHEQPWHCIPFSEAATAGIELFYPYEDELHVSQEDGQVVFRYPGRADGTPTDIPPIRSLGQG